MKPLKIVFMGSPEFAVPSLTKIYNSSHNIVAVISQPDRPKGRGKKLQPTAVKLKAQEFGIKNILQPLKMRDTEFQQKLKSLDADIFAVVAFRILPNEILDLAKISTINLHPSKLPKYRGAAPLNWSIINGEKETAATIIRITEKIDGGGILAQKDYPVYPDETAGELHDRMAEAGAELLLDVINRLSDGPIKPVIQDESQVTAAPKLTPEICHLNFDQPAEKVKNWIHGLSPSPAAFAMLDDQKVKLFRAKVFDEDDFE